jgi:hypothetical protein
VAHPGDGQRLPVRLDTALSQKGEEAIQQAGVIQPVDRIDAFPTVQGLGDDLIIPFHKLPSEQCAQIRVDFFNGLAGLPHRCLLLVLDETLFRHKSSVLPTFGHPPVTCNRLCCA